MNVNIKIFMGKCSVAVIKGKEPIQMVKESLELIGAKGLITSEDRVLIKPNYISAQPPSTGVTTDPRVVEGIIKFVKDLGVKDIVVGEGGAGDTEIAFDIVGIRDVVSRQKTMLVNLNVDRRVNVKILQALALQEIGVAETALKSTCIINVPKLKVHHMALVTLCMKNLMGIILPKSIMHDQINWKIVDLATLFKDKVKINIIDGLIGSEISETHGQPVEMNLIIAGRDMVAVDTVATAIMGINPRDVKYLGLAEERGLGISDLDEIEILGEKIEEVQRKFILPPFFKNQKTVRNFN